MQVTFNDGGDGLGPCCPINMIIGIITLTHWLSQSGWHPYAVQLEFTEINRATGMPMLSEHTDAEGDLKMPLPVA